MAKEKYLLDENFLIEMDNLQIRHQYARITVLDFKTEARIEDITGRITTGNISVNGDSAVRRTANLTFVIDDVNNFNMFQVSNLLSINKKIKLEVGLENTTDKYIDNDIIWFPQGIYIISSISVSSSTSGVTASLQLKDKMCLLNGDFGGTFPAQTRLDKVYDIDANGVQVVNTPTIYQIIQEAVCHFGGENLGKIIINDVGTLTYQTMRWGANYPAYVITNANSTYTFTTNENDIKNIPTYRYTKYEMGDEICYAPVEFVYPTGTSGELSVSAGGTVTSVLDNIKNVLGNFEYFYDLDGNFIFQEIKNYLNTSQANFINENLLKGNESEYYLSRVNGKSIYSFIESPLVISYNVNPNYINIKNDYVVWGNKKGNDQLLIRYHLAIDEKPELTNFKEVYIYLNSDDLICASIPYNLKNYTTKIDGEIIYYKTVAEAGIGTPSIIYRYIDDNTLLTYQTKVINTWNSYNVTGSYEEILEWTKKVFVPLKDEDITINPKKADGTDKTEEEITQERIDIKSKTIEQRQDEYKKSAYRQIMAIKDILTKNTINADFAKILCYNDPIIYNDELHYICYYYWDELKGKYLDVSNSGQLYTNYKPDDWRTVLYLQGSAALPYGTDSNYYYAELKNEWPKIYDLRPKQDGGYNSTVGPWYKGGSGQSLWSKYVENPQLMEYYLDFITPNSRIGAFSINNIGRRQKIESVKEINCVFGPNNITDTVAIQKINEGIVWRKVKSNSWKTIKETKHDTWGVYASSSLEAKEEIEKLKNNCYETGRAFTEVDENIRSSLSIGLAYSSAFERIRANLANYTDYAETINITSIPIFHLEPNTRITILNKNLNINGDYFMKSFSIPLGNGTMSIQANKVIERI